MNSFNSIFYGVEYMMMILESCSAKPFTQSDLQGMNTLDILAKNGM